MRKPVKPTYQQRSLIERICHELNAISRTNDIDSPTHYTDLDNFLNSWDIEEPVKRKISKNLKEIFTLIKHYDSN